MANKVIQVYPTDLTVKRVKETAFMLFNTNGISSESGAINRLIVRLGNVEKEVKELKADKKRLKGEILDLKGELGEHQDNHAQKVREDGV